MSIFNTHHTPNLKSLLVPKQRKHNHKKNTKIDMIMSMVLVQVKRKHGKVLRRHVSQTRIPKHLQSLKDEVSKGMVIKVSSLPRPQYIFPKTS